MAVATRRHPSHSCKNLSKSSDLSRMTFVGTYQVVAAECAVPTGLTVLGSCQRRIGNSNRNVGRGWSMQGVVIIGWDGFGNPFGIEASSGRILVEDHNFGGIHEMADSLLALLSKGLLTRD